MVRRSRFPARHRGRVHLLVVHELSVALRIRQSLEEEFADEPDLHIVRVGLQVGALAGVVPAALEFAWAHAVADSPVLAESRVDIEWIDVTGVCQRCTVERTITSLASIRCPVCSDPLAELTGGDELDIATVDVRNRILGPP